MGTRDRAQLSDDGCANFARHSRLVYAREEQAAQAAGRDFASQVSVVDLVADAAAKVLRRGFALAWFGANGCLRGLFTSGARNWFRVGLVQSGPGGIQNARTEVGHSVFDDPSVEFVDR